MLVRTTLAIGSLLLSPTITAQQPKLRQRSGGLHGYIGVRIEAPPPDFGFGASYHATAWPLTPSPFDGFQIGLPSTWIVPDNRGYTEPLCPPGSVARNWTERGPSFASVFQTIEGGLGFWASTRFPSAVPKYRMNGTPSCYSFEVSSPGFGFGRMQALAADQLALAQVSNRLLVPPDGLTLKAGDSHELIGSAWMALPWVERRGPHRIALRATGPQRCLCVDAQGALALAPRGEGAHEVWDITPAADGAVHIALSDAPHTPLDAKVDAWVLLHDGGGDVLRAARGGDSLLAPDSQDDAVRWSLEPLEHGDVAPTGDLAWTFFLDADNFRGPVAFWIPSAWSAIANGYPPAAGRTLDCRAGEMGSGAMEVNTVPMFEARSADGRRFTRIPRIEWPIDDDGRSWLMQDVRFYAHRGLGRNPRVAASSLRADQEGPCRFAGRGP
ncbi:MAG: hypothetical protein U1F36_20515 [Planctomycetota bacterium]